jgi:hypothetical protein
MKVVMSVPLGQQSWCNMDTLEEQYWENNVQLLDVIRLFPQQK